MANFARTIGIVTPSGANQNHCASVQFKLGFGMERKAPRRSRQMWCHPAKLFHKTIEYNTFYTYAGKFINHLRGDQE
jgi:hypothetical protein